jgi:cytochrome c oxidase subunit 3
MPQQHMSNQAAISRQSRWPSNAVLGTTIFIATEIMLFAAFMSAYTIARVSALGGEWPPSGQPRFPVEQTAINTVPLLLSAILLWSGSRIIRRNPERLKSGLRYVAAAIVMGILFVSLQGVEWVRLLSQGLTLTSSAAGSFFYLIVGAHALHAVVAIALLSWACWRLQQRALPSSLFTAIQLFWYFVVILWPVIYLRVYL